MSALKSIFAQLLPVLAAGLMLGGKTAHAQDEVARPNPLLNPPHLLTWASHDRARPGTEPILYTFITAPNVRGGMFAVQTPAQHKLEYDTRAGALRFTRTNQSSWITIRLISIGSGTASIDAEATGKWLVRQRLGTKLLKSGATKVGGLSGFSYDLMWATSGNLSQVQRIVFVPTALGIIEFTLNSTPDKFLQYEPGFGELLFSFKLCPNGKHDLTPPPSDGN